MTPSKRLHHGGCINLELRIIVKNIFFEVNVTSTKYKLQKINMWPKTFIGDHKMYRYL